MLIAIGLSACGDPAPTATPPAPTSTPRPAATSTTPPPQTRKATDDEVALIEDALNGVEDLQSYHFDIEIEPSEFITQPVKAEGDFEAPDMTYVKGTMGRENFEYIVVGDVVFEQDSGGDWVIREEPAADPTDPTSAFDPNTLVTSGNPLDSIGELTEAVTEYQYEGDVQVDGVTTKHFTFDLDLEKMMAGQDMEGMDLSGLDLGGGGFYIDEDEKKLYGIEYNIDISALLELFVRAFSSFGGTPTPGGVPPTPLPKLEVKLNMKITQHDDPSIKVPVTDEMRQMIEDRVEPTEEPFEFPTEEPFEFPTEEVEATPEAGETPEAEATEDPDAIPTIPGLPSGDGQTHEGQVGEPVDVGWARFTVDSVERNHTGMMSPPDGKEFMMVTVTVENTGSEEEQLVSSLFNVKVFTPEGEEVQQTFLADYTNQLDGLDTSMVKGDKITGEIAYEVDEGATGLVLEFYPYPFFDEDTKARIPLD
jgi:hypothetical protein